MYASWTVRHKPKTLREIIGNPQAIADLVSWLRSWEQGIPKKRAALLYGPPGIGKTVTVEALASDWSLELVEKNASDYRTEEAVRTFAGLASQYGTLFGKKRLVLFDELDGLTGREDRGGVGAIIKVVKQARCPIVLIANNAYNPRLSSLRFYCLLIQFKKPNVRSVAKRLQQICQREGIEPEEEALKFIAQRSQGDVRSAINDLQALAQGKQQLTYEDVSWLAYRDRKDAIFNVLRLIFYSKSCDAAKSAVDMADVDHNMLFEWIYENMPYHLRDLEDLARAMESLATADLYRSRIRQTRNWKLTRYVVDFMTAGVAVAREKTEPAGFVPLRFPERIKTLSRTKKERQTKSKIGWKIKRRCHISAAEATTEFLPYLRVIFENNAGMASGIAKWLELDDAMVEYLAGTKKQAKAIVKAD
ncbi:MAG: replication factor C large subunit [Candidatus Bathyarchaeota archaeon]|nr:replication factor C large subunit [Candidatus Bathyarchaeota archaeon]